MIVIVDNYDSFVFNLYQYVGGIEPDVRVVRNDGLSAQGLAALNPERIILSPGPGRPADAGICEEILTSPAIAQDTPILGVCLGHQAICEAFGAQVGYAKRLMHGKSSLVSVDRRDPLFADLPETIQVARYHSLAADRNAFPECLRITAQTQDGEVMAVSHATRPIHGVQFHPESILTPCGMKILENFLRE